MTGPTRPTTRRFWPSVSAVDASTSNDASTRVSEVFACCPPGPLEREKRRSTSDTGRTTLRVTRIDSPCMSAILLDVDGVLHVSGRPIPGAAEAVASLREAGHRLRFVTNSTTRSRATLATELRAMSIELEDDEIQTTPRAAARALAGRRVLALTLPAIIDELEGVELVGDSADAVLIGGADEDPDQTGAVFSYLNLARAFAELDTGAELFCLHKNAWWQTGRGPLLDSGAFVAGLEYATGLEATVLGKPSAPFFLAALEALDADPELAWMIGDDIDADIAGAQKHGMKTALVRTGKFRPDAVEDSGVMPDAILSSIADLPDWLERRV